MQTLEEATLQFLQHCEHSRKFSIHTVKAYRLDLKRFATFVAQFHPSRALSGIDRAVLREYARNLSGYKPRSQRRHIAALKSFFSYLEAEGIAETNCARSLRLNVRVGTSLPRTVGLDKMEAILRQVHAARPTPGRSATVTIRDVALLELMFASGMRVSEISNLRMSSIDLERGVVMVQGKGNKERLIPICEASVQAALRCYLRRRPTAAVDFFFLNRNGSRLSEQSIRQALRRHATAIGASTLTPHVFRHTVATLLLEQGVDLRFIQTFLGHSSIVTTTIYVHVNEKSQRNVLQQLHPRRLITLNQNPHLVDEG